MRPKSYEEEKVISTFWGWVILVIFSLSILAWAMLLMTVVKTATPYWDFGTLPDTPGKSVYSTITPPPPTQEPSLQIAPLPERKQKEEMTGDAKAENFLKSGGRE